MSPQQRPTTQYVRTRNGSMIHRADCTQLFTPQRTVPIKATPWNWAEGKTVDQIRQEMAALGLEARFCRACIREACR